MGANVGYARCSTDKQDLTAQRQQLAALGVPADRIYLDEGLTGIARDRPGLGQALAAVRDGDTFTVTNPGRFRLMGPDETASNRLSAVCEVTDRAWDATTLPGDDHLSPDGRVMEVLSEHLCQGWLEGYLLTGRHGLFNCYEAFIHIIDSMFNQHAKWLKVTRAIPWRAPVASLNYLLASHVWRQDNNGFSHQDPGSSTT